MAKCTIGPFGALSGKIGNMVFYMLNGQLICRLVGKQGKPSKKQLSNRQAMTITMELLKPLKEFINVSFRLEAEGTLKNPHNLATSYNKKQALTGEYLNIKVDYNKVTLSSGSLEMAKDLKISKGEDGLILSWDTSISNNASSDDILMVAISHPTKKQASTSLNAAKRADGTCFIPLESWKMTAQMEVYVCFKSSNEKLISDSAYAGNLNGAAESEAEKAKYKDTKARFDLVAANYEQKKMDYAEGLIKAKPFRHLEKEYQVLKEKLAHLPGKAS